VAGLAQLPDDTELDLDDADPLDDDEDRTWKKSDATKFRAAFQTIIRTIDRGAELDQLTDGEHAAFLSTYKKFGNDWQKLFSEQEWL
jgi:hypothetical protein